MTPRERFAPTVAWLSGVMDPLSNEFRQVVRDAEAAIQWAMADARASAIEDCAKVADAEVKKIESAAVFYNHDTYLPSLIAHNIRALPGAGGVIPLSGDASVLPRICDACGTHITDRGTHACKHGVGIGYGKDRVTP